MKEIAFKMKVISFFFRNCKVPAGDPKGVRHNRG